jgi:hypothetical protein
MTEAQPLESQNTIGVFVRPQRLELGCVTLKRALADELHGQAAGPGWLGYQRRRWICLLLSVDLGSGHRHTVLNPLSNGTHIHMNEI